MAQDNTGSSGNPIGDLIVAAVGQAINQSTDHAHDVSVMANTQFGVKDHGLLYGPYNPKHGSD
jgi:hypothetical protein